MGVQGTTVAVVRVPFGWHQAPGQVQHIVASAIAKVPAGTVVVVQYLDNILFLGRDKQEVARVTGRVANQLIQEGYLISPKSQTGPVHNVT